jgi:hypothetical protein
VWWSWVWSSLSAGEADDGDVAKHGCWSCDWNSGDLGWEVVVGREGGQMGKAGGWQVRSTSYICDVSTPIKHS